MNIIHTYDNAPITKASLLWDSFERNDGPGFLVTTYSYLVVGNTWYKDPNYNRNFQILVLINTYKNVGDKM